MPVNRGERGEEIAAQVYHAEVRLLDPGDARVIDEKRLPFKAKFSRGFDRCRYLRKCNHQVVMPLDTLPPQVAEGGLRAIGRIEVHPAGGKTLLTGRAAWLWVLASIFRRSRSALAPPPKTTGDGL